MFAKKEEETSIMPLNGYSNDVVNRIRSVMKKESVEGEILEFISMNNVKWDNVNKVSIDKMSFRILPNKSITWTMKEDVTSKYIASWKASLGRWILNDVKKRTNLDKYFFLYWGNGRKISVAFIREVNEDDIDENETLDDLLSDKFISLKVDEKYYLLMKVFEFNKTVDAEVLIGVQNDIMNEDEQLNLGYQSSFDEIDEMENMPVNSDNEDSELTVDFENHDMLF